MISRGVRVTVARGSIEYSAVTQPLPEPRRNCGTVCSMVAAHSTRVLPTSISAEPSAVCKKSVAMRTGRISAGVRLSGRMVLARFQHGIEEQRHEDRSQHDKDDAGDRAAGPGGGGLLLLSCQLQFRHC